MDVGEFGNWLVADYWEPCPLDHRGEIIYTWSFACVFLYPVGVPVFFLLVMIYFRIPQMSMQKIRIAKLQATIDLYRHDNLTAEGDALLLHMAKISTQVSQQRGLKEAPFITSDDVLAEFFRRVDADGGGTISLEELSEYMQKEHLCDELGESSHSHLLEMVRLAARKGCEMDLSAFSRFCKDLHDRHSMFSGSEVPSNLSMDADPTARLSRKQLECIIEYEWALEDLEEDSELAKLAQQEVDGYQGGNKGRRMSREEIFIDEMVIEKERRLSVEGSDKPVQEESSDETPKKRLAKRELQKAVMHKVEELVRYGLIVVPLMPWNGTLKEETDALNKIGFLFTMYSVEHWYFEMVEMIRKLMITSILVFVYPGEPAQLAAGVVVSFGSLVIYYSARPFVSANLTTLQIFSLITQCINLFYGIMLIVSECPANTGPRSSKLIEWLVVMLNCLVFAVPVLNAALMKITEVTDLLSWLLPWHLCFAPQTVDDEDEEEPSHPSHPTSVTTALEVQDQGLVFSSPTGNQKLTVEPVSSVRHALPLNSSLASEEEGSSDSQAKSVRQESPPLNAAGATTVPLDIQDDDESRQEPLSLLHLVPGFSALANSMKPKNEDSDASRTALQPASDDSPARKSTSSTHEPAGEPSSNPLAFLDMLPGPFSSISGSPPQKPGHESQSAESSHQAGGTNTTDEGSTTPLKRSASPACR